MPGTADWDAPITPTLVEHHHQEHHHQEHHHQEHHHLAHHHQRQKREERMMAMAVEMAMHLKHVERLQKPMTVAMETIWM